MNAQAVETPLDTMIRGEIERNGIPGLTLAVASPERVLAERAYGLSDLAGGKPARPDDIMDMPGIASLIHVTVLSMLIHRGLVEPGEALGNRMEIPSGRLARTTVDELLRHRTGLRDKFPDLLGCGSAARRRPSLGTLSPGRSRRATFSEANGFLMAQLVERVSGKPAAEVATEELLARSGIHGLHAASEHVPTDRRASGTLGLLALPTLSRLGRAASAGVKFTGRRGIYTTMEPVSRMPGADAVGTAESLARFGVLHLGTEVRLEGGFPEPEIVREIQRIRGQIQVPRLGALPASYGWWHGGGGKDAWMQILRAVPGHSAMLRVYPERGISIAILYNRFDISGMVERICAALVREFGNHPPVQGSEK